MRKKAFTLIEVMIALVLASILLTTLFGFYRELFLTRSNIQKCKEAVLQRVWTQQRLTQVLEKALPEIEKEKGLVFYSAEHSKALGPVLYFFYENGIDPDPHYCGALKAMLYLSLDKNLTLCTWPGREEILFEGIHTIRFSFFDLKKMEWKESWLGEKEGLPAMIKLWLNKEEFVFFLPGSTKKISYKK